MNRKGIWPIGAIVCLCLCLGGVALADGTETLGPPGIAIATGDGIVAAGIGLRFGQPGTINIDVPGDVKQALLYWQGVSMTASGDDSVTVNGTDVTGIRIGGFTSIPDPGTYTATYRADITGLVSSGANALDIAGMDFERTNDGAGVLVIYESGGLPTEIDIRDGNDFAYIFSSGGPELLVTVPQTFSITPEQNDRTGDLVLFASDVEPARPNAVDVTSGGVTTKFVNPFVSSDGPDWDTVRLTVDIPAGADSVTVEAISEGDGSGRKPASLVWDAAALAVEQAQACRVTGGGNDSDPWDGSMASGKSGKSNQQNVYTFGGQAGAPTASQPQPKGEWTHHQQRGPDGSFVFHAGTASAPDGTEIDRITCSDPGNCLPARKAPNKQIDFEGVGTFKNIKNPSPPLAGVVPGDTFHWFEVHIEDLGEPGKGGKIQPPADTCPVSGTPGGVADCDCPDFYTITIYKEFDPDSEAPNKTDVIYSVEGYLKGGNLQIHPPIK